MRVLATTAFVLAAGLAGCEQEGPAEQAGERIDETVEEMGDSVENMTDEAGGQLEAVGDQVEQSTD